MAPLTEAGSVLEPNPYLRCTVAELAEGGGDAAIRIGGALCAITADEHSRQLGELVERGYIRLRIELAELTLCTSDGLDLWDDLQHRLDPLAGRVTLVGARGVVRRVLDVVQRPDSHFCPTVEAAA